ncbi:peptidase M20 domain-containing protein 2-like [Strongylocentrotus purpuratus]|uniref:Peptidase M20 domain-containing protein 2 n=1 Tax=Strongylocentrotus purpuratus TaxID=7668 RepID=A0A7M7SXD4_STRPU|nr:peptidase M20 domain-containing protein 2-like [Strongylocentrotus purpuratus]
MTEWNKRKQVAQAKIDESASDLNNISQEIWSHPELGYEEHHAHKILTDYLEKEGFEVTRNYHLETAFKATYGTDGGIHVCVISEYDALPEIGHACGHNLIAECGAAAGLGIKAAMELDGTPIGRVTVLGTPAEEGAGGKVDLIKAGAFQGMDVAMMAHPYAYTVPQPVALSMLETKIHFTGLASHASAVPWEGVNALDAAVMCYTSISVMRQQLKPEWRVHGVFTNGGARPNIIPEEAELLYYLRAPDSKQLDVLQAKVKGCAKGAAIATGCELECKSGCNYANMIHNNALSLSFERHAEILGFSYPSERRGEKGGSTDMGNVSYVLPSIHPKFGIPTDSGTHTPGFTKWAGMLEAQSPTLIQAKAIAMTGIDVMDPNTNLLKSAQEEFKKAVSGLT